MEASESPQFTISPTARRYALAGLAAVGALLLRKMLSPWFGTTNVYHTVGRQSFSPLGTAVSAPPLSQR